MRNRRTKWFGLAAGLLAIAIGGAVHAGETPVRDACDVVLLDDALPATQGGTALAALRPTLLIVADDYEKKALDYTKEAERFRAWASAEEMFGGTTYGKRYAAIYFADEANEAESQAAKSREMAAKYRSLAESTAASSGC